MTMATRFDLQNIYDNQVRPTELFNELTELLDSLAMKYADRAVLRTRNNDNKILSFSGIKYFTFVELSDKVKAVTVFAGALQKPPRGNKLPVVRVRSNNQHLARIPGQLKFPFEGERNPNWTNIVISSNTIDVLKELLPAEVEEYFRWQES